MHIYVVPKEHRVILEDSSRISFILLLYLNYWYSMWVGVDPVIEMKTRVAKRSCTVRRALSCLKRKQATCYGMCLSGSTSLKFGKCRKLHGLKRKRAGSSSCSGRSLFVYYSNLKRSGSPQRLMYYKNGEWDDFPLGFVALVKDQVKNAAMTVEIDGHSFLLDFLHMLRIDLATGLQQPIAWIDEAGKCFFPETFTANDDLHDCCCSGYANDWMDISSERHNSNKIKLELEIAVDGSDCSRTKESSGESDTPAKKIDVANKLTGSPCAAEVDVICANISDHEVNRYPGNDLKETAQLKNENVNENEVKDMFMKGMGSLGNVEIVEIHKGSSTLSKARLKLFMKQAEIIKTFHGDSNIRYAWFSSSKEEASNILAYGIGCSSACKIKPIYGLGVHLLPVNVMHSSDKYWDNDENGAKHLIFCRVIMGEMELVHRGSEQMHPSSEVYDSGVNDLENPGWYVVWNMNLATHVYPEYVVTFRVSSDAKGSRIGKDNEVDISVVRTCGRELQVHLDSNAIPDVGGNVCHKLPARMSQETVDDMSSSTRKSHGSPSMPFSMLFSAISNKIASKELETVIMNYENYRNKNMSREAFIKILRSIVGDTLLRSVIADFQQKMPTKGGSNTDA